MCNEVNFLHIYSLVISAVPKKHLIIFNTYKSKVLSSFMLVGVKKRIVQQHESMLVIHFLYYSCHRQHAGLSPYLCSLVNIKMHLTHKWLFSMFLFNTK